MGPGRDVLLTTCSSSSLKVSMTMFGVEAFIEAMWDTGSNRTGSNRTGSNWIGVFLKYYTGHVTSARFFPYIPLEGHPETRDC